MVYICDVTLFEKKLLYIELAKIFGIGYSRSLYICGKVGLKRTVRVGQVSQKSISLIVFLITENYKINSDLKYIIKKVIDDQIEIDCYKARRKYSGYPANGQRTKTNANTARKINKWIGYRLGGNG